MKTPMPPPTPYAQFEHDMLRTASPEAILRLLSAKVVEPEGYVDWEWIRYHRPPEGFTREEWWLLLRGQRVRTAKSTPFTLVDGTPITWNYPDSLWKLTDEITAQARGTLELPQGLERLERPRHYLVSSLIEEAITSSQMEGASTSRVRAKEMLQEGQKPRDRSEQMILNNYEVMTWLREVKEQPLSADLVFEIHRRITAQTMGDPSEAGRLQQPGEERVRIYGDQGQEQILHIPPPAEELPQRLETLCAFANGGGDGYMPPLLRAITVHFMMGHDHYFVDGNGRTARAVFYWLLLNQGFFLAEYLSISRLLRRAPAQYARSFLLTEQDEGDLTHFLLFHAQIVSKAIDELHKYVARRAKDQRDIIEVLQHSDVNLRQMALLKQMVVGEISGVDVSFYRQNFGVAPQTARTDLHDLVEKGFLIQRSDGRRHYWIPDPNLGRRLKW
ncbi:Fic family protein [Schaalia sp. Marseille-Q2122]|uniref:Fic family protein n=1 Tax=Schaalia sp. Marseille-Q2122 TaxID=2736604 RepID=UPI0020CA8760|nr:Fic family protein [Schaalia sp. Marseille-Q2122]